MPRSKDKDYVVLNMRLPTALAARLDKLARARGAFKTHVVIEALEKHLPRTSK